VADMPEVPVMSTDVGERLHVAALVALAGPLTEQVRSTVPVNEFSGVTVMVEVLPVVAPGPTVKLPLLEREKLVLVLLGACQKLPHPARRGRAARKSQAHLACPIPARLIAAHFIAAPGVLVWGPDSPVSIARSRTMLRDSHVI
jgi:hypothetical protein